MTSIDADKCIPEDADEQALSVPLPQMVGPGPRFKDQACSVVAECGLSDASEEEVEEEGEVQEVEEVHDEEEEEEEVQEEDATIPMVSALFVSESQIHREQRNELLDLERQELEDRVQFELEREQLKLRQKDIELERQRLELERQQQQQQVAMQIQQQQQLREQQELERQELERQLLLREQQLLREQLLREQLLREQLERQQQQQQQSVSKKRKIGGIVLVMVAAVAVLVAGLCGSGNCHRGTPVTSAPAVAPVTSAPVVAPITSAPAVAPVTSSPIVAPITSAPVVAPVTSAPITSAPVVAPVTFPPSPVSTTTTDVPPVPVSISTTTRSSLIRSYINNITLTGRSFRYPNNSTAEERALLWLIDVDRSTTGADLVALRQRYALATIWFQTPTGFGRSGWATGITECDWDRVYCDATGRLVTSLDLSFVGVYGRIPADLGLLTDLTYLNLWDNALTGTIPSSIGLLTDLNYLDLSVNELTGAIPSSIGSLTALNDLDLDANVTDLNYLYLYNNGLMGTMPFCDSVPNRSFIELVVDCDKVGCPCCTHCCPTSRDGIPVYYICELQ